MKLYQQLGVTLAYQNFGSAWLGILRGKTEEIDLTFNGLFNLLATSGEMEFHDHTKCLATFWTSQEGMHRFFFNQFYLPRETGKNGQEKLVALANAYAAERIAELRESHEGFMRFDRVYMPNAYGIGTATAEKPDYNYRELATTSGLSDNGKTLDKAD